MYDSFLTFPYYWDALVHSDEKQGHQRRSALVVEDDPLMQTQFSSLLKSVDRELLIDRVATAEEARDFLDDEKAHHYDLVLADQFLAGTGTGLDLWHYCQRKHPRIPFILTSGSNLPAVLAGSGEAVSLPAFLQKPFSSVHGLFLIENSLHNTNLDSEIESDLSLIWASIRGALPSSQKVWTVLLIIFSVLFLLSGLSMLSTQRPQRHVSTGINTGGSLKTNRITEVEFDRVQQGVWGISEKVGDISDQAEEIILTARAL